MDQQGARALTDLGFVAYHDVSGRISIADLFPASHSRCGIYLLVLDDGLHYIGQSVDVVKRFAQHRQRFSNIAHISFQPAPRRSLDAVEQDLISRAEAAGVPLCNKEYVAEIRGVTDFDLVASPAEQAEWLQDAHRFDAETMRIENSAQRMRYLPEYARFCDHPLADRALALLTKYVKECVPFYRRTEMSFWSLSCLPNTNKNTWPRLACINMHAMEMFVIGYHKDHPDRIWAFANVAKSVLRKHRLSWRLGYIRVQIGNAHYQSASGDAVTVRANGEDMLRLLADPIFLNAARHLNLRLMRKGATSLFARFHSFCLADQVIG